MREKTEGERNAHTITEYIKEETAKGQQGEDLARNSLKQTRGGR